MPLINRPRGKQVSVYLQRQLLRLISGSMLMLAIAAVAPPAGAWSLTLSSLSGWLSRDVVDEIGQTLSQHPRYQGQRIQIEAGQQNGLSEAIVTLLNNNLAGRSGITLIAREPVSLPGQVAPDSIDGLDCLGAAEFDYLLQVSASSDESGHGRVQLTLVDALSKAEQIHSWQWRGKFSSAERKQFKNIITAANANGSLSAPWSEGDADAAALALSRDFACALRPQITSRIGLQWTQEPELAALFADTANTTRHRLGDYRELGIGSEQADYAVEVRIERFRDDIWQLWLTGTPRVKDLAPVQAVTYFRAGDPGWYQRQSPAVTSLTSRPAISKKPGYALEFIDVQMVDATQADKGRSKADLQVTLRISNRAQQPIAYSFTLSGGHFENCIAEPGYYRHDRYGLLSGSLEGGASVMRRLVIENAQHRPAPLYGVPKCAGFRDLQGFEEFASQGYKVTDYVRWDM